jgi:cob(I)alamin adenosyltransferase
MKLYTRTGDAGETGFLDGSRIAKSDPRVEAYGALDELNAILGVAYAQTQEADILEIFDAVQKDLMALGTQLADPNAHTASGIQKALLNDTDVERLESWIDMLTAETPPLRRFIVPGGSSSAAALHLARTVCRRAERRMVALGADQVKGSLLRYINRLSDLLFAAARVMNLRAGVSEREW